MKKLVRKSNNLKKSFIWNTLGSGLNAFNSLIFLVIVTRLNGLTDAGIFTLSFATASMFYVIAVYSGRTYQVTETDKDVTDNEYIAHRIITSLIMLIVSFLFAFINKYYDYKILIFMLLCIFKFTEALCDVFHGILQKNDRLDIVGKSLLLRSFLNIFVFLIVNLITKNLALSCGSLIITNVLILFLVDIVQSLKYKEKKGFIDFKAVFKIFTFGFFTFGFILLSNYIVNAPRYSIDSLLSDNAQTIFGIIVMPASIIMLANQFLIQPVIINLKNSYVKKDKKDFLEKVYRIVGITLIIGFLAIVLAFFFGIPLLNLLYGLNLNAYLYDLIIILIGATLYTVSSVFSNAMIILRKTKIQLLIYFITSVLAFIISLFLVKEYFFTGAIYSYLIIMLILLTGYIISFLILVNKKEIWDGGLIEK